MIVINYNRILMQQPDGREDCNKLQQKLDAAARWERDWLMAFHPDNVLYCLSLKWSNQYSTITSSITIYLNLWAQLNILV
jgi:hypothetical protein